MDCAGWGDGLWRWTIDYADWGDGLLTMQAGKVDYRPLDADTLTTRPQRK